MEKFPTPKQTKKELAPDRQEKTPLEVESINDGLGILLHRKILYHGSNTAGIEKFNPAEEDTVGSGLYLTSLAEDATKYARYRAEQRKGNPVLYESQVENLRLLDLRDDANIKKILPGFRNILQAELEGHNLAWPKQATLTAALEKIDSGAVGAGNLREVAWSHGSAWTEYVKSLGYEGLVTYEGGEGPHASNHESYIIFDPQKAQIIKEQQVNQENEQ